MTRSWEDKIGRASNRSGWLVLSAIALVGLIVIPTLARAFAAEPSKDDFNMVSLISFPPPPIDAETKAMTIGEWETLWTRVLGRSVDDAGRIDFDALAKNHADLDRVIAFIAAVDPMSQPQLFPDRQSRLAFYINAYNAVAMYGVVATGIPESLGGLTKFTFFYLRSFTIGGESISLYKFENNVIRPLGEERVHFALNCMVVSCPRLPRAAFDAAALDTELNTAAHEFVENPRNVSVDETRREVGVSAIFEFYTRDFLARAPSLVAYINRHRHERIPSDYAVRFLGYDWTVNNRKWAFGR
jgi:Protein of unknown function, DUF547